MSIPDTARDYTRPSVRNERESLGLKTGWARLPPPFLFSLPCFGYSFLPFLSVAADGISFSRRVTAQAFEVKGKIQELKNSFLLTGTAKILGIVSKSKGFKLCGGRGDWRWPFF